MVFSWEMDAISFVNMSLKNERHPTCLRKQNNNLQTQQIGGRRPKCNLGRKTGRSKTGRSNIRRGSQRHAGEGEPSGRPVDGRRPRAGPRARAGKHAHPDTRRARPCRAVEGFTGAAPQTLRHIFHSVNSITRNATPRADKITNKARILNPLQCSFCLVSPFW